MVIVGYVVVCSYFLLGDGMHGLTYVKESFLQREVKINYFEKKLGKFYEYGDCYILQSGKLGKHTYPLI